MNSTDSKVYYRKSNIKAQTSELRRWNTRKEKGMGMSGTCQSSKPYYTWNPRKKIVTLTHKFRSALTCLALHIVAYILSKQLSRVNFARDKFNTW